MDTFILAALAPTEPSTHTGIVGCTDPGEQPIVNGEEHATPVQVDAPTEETHPSSMEMERGTSIPTRLQLSNGGRSTQHTDSDADEDLDDASCSGDRICSMVCTLPGSTRCWVLCLSFCRRRFVFVL